MPSIRLVGAVDPGPITYFVILHLSDMQRSALTWCTVGKREYCPFERTSNEVSRSGFRTLVNLSTGLVAWMAWFTHRCWWTLSFVKVIAFWAHSNC